MRRKKLSLFVSSMLCLSVAVCGCGTAKEGTSETASTEIQATQAGYPVTVQDDFGNEVVLEEEPEKVISLSPSATEILFAIGAGDKMVGRTDYCSYPEEAAEVDPIGTYTEPNTELILSKEPDVVFVSDYLDDSVRAQIEATGASVVTFSANTVEAVENDILLAGQVLNLSDNAQGVVDGMETDLAELQEMTATVETKKSVFVDIGSFYSAGPGSLLDDELSELGIENIAADSGETWPQLSVETIIEKNPDVYLSLYTPVEELKTTAGLDTLDCIKEGNVIYYDGLSNEADMIQRPGPRVVEGMRLLAENIYPEVFSNAK